MKGIIVDLSANDAWSFIGPRHYAGRRPPISKAFGWLIDGQLVAVVTFGKPASAPLCDGICGKEFRHHVYELNRLCRTEELNEPLSSFVSACLRKLRANDWIIVSYSDTGMCHNGYIYQACNFLFTGRTKERTDKYVPGGKHARHYSENDQGKFRLLRTAKNRYVYFATNKSSLKKAWTENLRYATQPYPKSENKRYTLGEYQKPIIINTETNEVMYETGGTPCLTESQ